MNTLIYWFKYSMKPSMLLIVSYVLMILIFIFLFNKLPPQVPLYYSRPNGEEQIADSFYLLLIPILSFTIVVTNRIVAKKYFSENEFVKRVIYYASNSLIIILTTIFLKILFLIS